MLAAISIHTRNSHLLEKEFVSCISEKEIDASTQCIRAKRDSWLTRYGIPSTLAQLDAFEKVKGPNSHCHLAAHVIGEGVFYSLDGNVGKSLDACSLTCYSGCLHGVMQAYSSRNSLEDMLSSNLGNYCTEQTEKPFSCMHALGHGFMIATDYDALRSAQACKELRTATTSMKSCASGVFMELYTTALGLGHAHISEEKYSKEGDPFYICSVPPIVNDEIVARPCFLNIIPWLHSLFRIKVEDQAIFDVCKRAPRQWISSCTDGIVRLQAYRTPNDLQKIASTCYMTDTDTLRISCLFEAMFMVNMHDSTGRDLESLCSFISPEDGFVCKPQYIERIKRILGPEAEEFNYWSEEAVNALINENR